MLSKRGIQTYFAGDNFRASPSFRDPGALSGPLAGVSFVGGVAGAMPFADSPTRARARSPRRSAATSGGAPARPGSAWSASWSRRGLWHGLPCPWRGWPRGRDGDPEGCRRRRSPAAGSPPRRWLPRRC